MRPLPVIVRVAGLPGTALSGLGSQPLLALSSNLRQLRQSVQQSHSALANRIAVQLSRFSTSERRFLLDVRRDCFNHRDLSRHIKSPNWALVEDVSPDLATWQPRLQEELEAAEGRLQRLFESELARELEDLHQWATDPQFLRGLALSSADVVQALREDRAHLMGSRRDYTARDRRQRKLDQTLLRFVTRAAAKLSPNSTLTTLALGRIEADANEPLCMPAMVTMEERSCLHLDRVYLDQLQELLLFAPEIRTLCRVTINDTLEETDAQGFRWIRPSRRQVNEEKRRLVLTPLSLVKAQLDTALLALIRQSLALGIDSYEELSRCVSLQAGERPAQEGAAPPWTDATLDHLIEIGLLQLVPPWSTGAELPGEVAVLHLLQSREFKNPLVNEFRRGLAKLVELERSFPTALDPHLCFLEMRLQLDALRELAGCFAPIPNGLAFPSLSQINRLFHESVFLLAAADTPEPEQAAAMTLHAEPVEEIYRIAQALYRFIDLFNHRHDLLHSLEYFWHANFADEPVLSVPELFRRVSPLWKQYITFDREQRDTSRCTFNPYDLPEVHRLAERREQVYRSLQSCFVATANGYQVPPRSLAALLHNIPDRYHPQVGPSVLVQPLQDPNELWVLNRLLEGTGRYTNRYIAALPPELGKALATQLNTRARVRLEGEVAELLDLTCVRGGQSEVHHPQTPWLLEIPGDKIEVSDERKLRLSQLRVHLDKDRGRIVLRTTRGQRLLPVHLTSLNHRFLPSILRFLAAFGPYEVRQVFPRSRQVTHSSGCHVSERVACGRLVVSRKRWELTLEAISDLQSASTSGVPSHKFYHAVQAWRERLGIPAEVYIYEKIHSPRENLFHYKPQFLDFTSPLMSQLFAVMIRKKNHRFIIDEALPSRDQLLTCQDERRAMEIQFECIWPWILRG